MSNYILIETIAKVPSLFLIIIIGSIINLSLLLMIFGLIFREKK